MGGKETSGLDQCLLYDCGKRERESGGVIKREGEKNGKDQKWIKLRNFASELKVEKASFIRIDHGYSRYN